MIFYLDSSVVLRPLLAQPKSLQGWGKWTTAYSSELLGLECRRAIDRLRLEALFDDQQVAEAMEQLSRIERTIKRIRLSRSILQGASRTMPTIVKTLDAIHLASAIAIRERRGIELLFATHDNQQATAARALGFTCIEA
jgi:predicted nucleic acid-binding protein